MLLSMIYEMLIMFFLCPDVFTIFMCSVVLLLVDPCIVNFIPNCNPTVICEFKYKLFH